MSIIQQVSPSIFNNSNMVKPMVISNVPFEVTQGSVAAHEMETGTTMLSGLNFRRYKPYKLNIVEDVKLDNVAAKKEQRAVEAAAKKEQKAVEAAAKKEQRAVVAAAKKARQALEAAAKKKQNAVDAAAKKARLAAEKEATKQARIAVRIAEREAAKQARNVARRAAHAALIERQRLEWHQWIAEREAAIVHPVIAGRNRANHGVVADRRDRNGDRGIQRDRNGASKTQDQLIIVEKAFKANECPICLNDITETNVMTLRCGHQACGDCMFHHFQTVGGTKCPVCREQFAVRVEGWKPPVQVR